MRASHPKPDREPRGPILSKMVSRLTKTQVWAIVEAGPLDPNVGRYYVEAYTLAHLFEREAIDSLEV